MMPTTSKYGDSMVQWLKQHGGGPVQVSVLNGRKGSCPPPDSRDI